MITKEKPPNWGKLVDMFGVEWGPTVVTWEPNIHCGFELSSDVIEHEEVHIIQQRAIGVEEWWKRFYADPQFRYAQELEAYQKQYRYLRNTVKDRNELARRLSLIAGFLSGEMYGGIVSHSEAVRAIRG